MGSPRSMTVRCNELAVLIASSRSKLGELRASLSACRASRAALDASAAAASEEEEAAAPAPPPPRSGERLRSRLPSACWLRLSSSLACIRSM